MPVGCQNEQPTGFLLAGRGGADKVLRDFNDPNDLNDFKVSNALKYRRLCPLLREKFSPTLKSG